MENVQFEVKENELTIKVDISRELGRSKSGKTIVIATSHGNVQIVPGVFMGLNVYKYPTAR